VPNEPKGRSGATRVGVLSESLEDYLEIVLQLQQEKRVARVRDIAARKGVSNASVSNALARLARDGFVLHEAHEFVELTDRGAELARRVLRRHEFLVSFLHDVLLVSREGAEGDAHAIEHHVSAETLERLAIFYQFVCSCPRAGISFLDAFKACCAQKDGPATGVTPGTCVHLALQGGTNTVLGCVAGGTEQELVRLNELPPGDAGIIVRLEATSEVRKRLVELGRLPNVLVEVRRGTLDQLELSVQGCSLSIATVDAVAVLVRRVTTDQSAGL
jgi:DtxR family Mn-dependent transcriptional regulator